MIKTCAFLLAIGVAQGAFAEPGDGKAASYGPADVDKSVSPCNDFYHFACGNWLKANPVPADQPIWGRFNELLDRNQAVLKGILEKAEVPDPKRSPRDQRIGDFYHACMDEARAESLGASPLKGELDAIAAVKAKGELPSLVARLQGEGVNVFASFGVGPDFKEPKVVIAQVDQAGLGLPDKDSYLQDDPHQKELREKYVAHLSALFTLLGDSKETSDAEAKTLMEIETELAKASLDRTARREPEKRYHKMTGAELQALSPAFSWSAYFKETGAPAFASLNVAAPDYVTAMGAIVEKRSLSDLKTYLRGHLVNAAAKFLSKAFAAEDFAFYGKGLTGQAEQQPRWKRCVEQTDTLLGDDLGQGYVAATFGPEGKARMLKMVLALEHSLDRDIADLPWMTPATRAQAKVKLDAITNKIGYPENWRTYASLKISPDDLLGNVARASAYESRFQAAKVGTPTDKKEWDMTPPTVNADYDATHNDINFPAGILQPPFFDKGLDDALNFGAIGAVIGHELTHGFDDQGRKFAADGSLNNWWSDADAKEFEKRTQCVVDQYAAYSPVGDLKLNGKLTLGENTADNGGLRIALSALREVSKDASVKDGFTPDQRFFLGWAQAWCEGQKDEIARLRVQVDPHSDSQSRVNGPLSNMPEFQRAYECKAGAPMVRETMCRVW
jgi:endothelin-converting enzyme/putative endopeptidase